MGGVSRAGNNDENGNFVGQLAKTIMMTMTMMTTLKTLRARDAV